MRLLAAAAVSLLALAACQKDPPEPTPEELGQDEPGAPFKPAPPDPPRTYEATSRTAMALTPGVLTFTPTAQTFENMPPGAVFAFGNGIILETTLNPGGATSGATPPDWTKVFSDPAGPIDPEKVVLYNVDAETVPPAVASGGLCRKTGFIATYTVKSPGAEDLMIAAFETSVWPPTDANTLCGTFMYSNVH